MCHMWNTQFGKFNKFLHFAYNFIIDKRKIVSILFLFSKNRKVLYYVDTYRNIRLYNLNQIFIFFLSQKDSTATIAAKFDSISLAVQPNYCDWRIWKFENDDLSNICVLCRARIEQIMVIF
jgi:hypothetical protein